MNVRIWKLRTQLLVNLKRSYYFIILWFTNVFVVEYEKKFNTYCAPTYEMSATNLSEAKKECSNNLICLMFYSSTFFETSSFLSCKNTSSIKSEEAPSSVDLISILSPIPNFHATKILYHLPGKKTYTPFFVLENYYEIIYHCIRQYILLCSL